MIFRKWNFHLFVSNMCLCVSVFCRPRPIKQSSSTLRHRKSLLNVSVLVLLKSFIANECFRSNGQFSMTKLLPFLANEKKQERIVLATSYNWSIALINHYLLIETPISKCVTNIYSRLWFFITIKILLLVY